MRDYSTPLYGQHLANEVSDFHSQNTEVTSAESSKVIKIIISIHGLDLVLGVNIYLSLYNIAKWEQRAAGPNESRRGENHLLRPIIPSSRNSALIIYFQPSVT